MKCLFLIGMMFWTGSRLVANDQASMQGQASWYGEAHRGKPMANGHPFDPDRLTAASWFYPLGTQVRVSLQSNPQRSVLVIITDRGPARSLVRQGRVIDLANGAFKKLADPDLGLIEVNVVAVADTLARH